MIPTKDIKKRNTPTTAIVERTEMSITTTQIPNVNQKLSRVNAVACLIICHVLSSLSIIKGKTYVPISEKKRKAQIPIPCKKLTRKVLSLNPVAVKKVKNSIPPYIAKKTRLFQKYFFPSL